MIETLIAYLKVAALLLTYGGIAFFIAAFISKFFKWAPFRILLLWFSLMLFVEVLQSEQILFNINLYIALGMAAPHIKFAHILAFRMYYGLIDLYHRLVEIFYLLLRPFVFVCGQYARFRAYYDSRENQREYSRQEQEQRNYEEFRQREGFNDYRRSNKQQQSHQREEQSSRNQESRSPGGDSGPRQSQTPRWDSPDPYIVLDLSRDATAQDIKKQYRKLQKLYHPDLTQTKKEEYTRISQQINAAYSKLKGVQ